ncbi:NB-ARC domain-containing protein [Mycena venus]|uniref:NB-ARC domain-containing protein n=1 Tax=Mycena venus TaxID=2733690 RepID=A0A8H6Y7I4_9AGAR|nr:NB-ARC domain-containing protein [Mycena venus]
MCEGQITKNRTSLTPPPCRPRPGSEQLIQYTTVAASTAREIANAANVPFLQVIAALTVTILDTVQSVRTNREQCTIMIEQIHEILCTIVHLYSDVESDGGLSKAHLQDIARFAEALQRIYGFMKMQQGMSKIKQLFKQFDNATQLKQCQEELQRSLETFRLQTRGATIDAIAQMQVDAQRQHEDLLALVAAHPDLTSSDRSSLAGTLSSSVNSSNSSLLLPAYPQIFHGRDSELEEIVTTLKQDSARIAILGTGGMGKTSLAVTALHHSDVEAKFPNRFFIPCHSTVTRSDLVSSIASHVGVAVGPNLARKVVRHLSYGPPVLLILDNFETPWEPGASRSGVEEFLLLLTDIPHLALIVTMRGAERPSRVKWTRPFLPPLNPLDDDAALKTFLDITDDEYDQTRVRELLDLTGNLPLAVNLIANVVVYEGCDATLARWRTESTRVLSDGYDKKSSLDISIMLSFTSARMTSQAQDLASILSMLPDGISDAELVQSNLPIENILAAKVTLIRTSLAYISKSHRLCALVPIREYVRATHPPSAELKSQLRNYFRDVIALWKEFRLMPSSDSVLQIGANLGNIHSIMDDGLHDDAPDLLDNLASMMVLSGFCRMRNNDSSPLMPRVEDLIVHLPERGGAIPSVYGKFFADRFFASRNDPIKNPQAQMELATKYYEHAPELERAQWYNALAAYYSAQGQDLEESIRYRERAIALQATAGMSNALCTIGNYSASRAQAQTAQQMAELLGDLFEQAQAVGVEARCCVAVGDFKVAARLCQRARALLLGCGLQGTDTDWRFQSFEAEIHDLRTEYPEARAIHAQLAYGVRRAHSSAFDLLNIATIDTATGADSALVRRSLDAARKQFTTSFSSPQALLLCDAALANLLLRDCDTDTARAMFEGLVVKLRLRGEGASFCLERLADPDQGMYDAKSTLRWAAIYLGWALKAKNKLAKMKALRHLARIAAIEKDEATAFEVFQVVLDGFTAMDVHSWRADCMVGIAEILITRGDALRGEALLKSARPLFDRCMQKEKVGIVDGKLAALSTSSYS